ncbi:MAG: prepilin-type N-terminal cleavage/methylation domain-containing protein [Candidatus Omnitrophota bacterium]|jgi:prepilin-type N-terminal cleavage/methylation domain-containing protein
MEKKGFTPLEKIHSVREYSSLTGFTLLELLIVIIIVGILATLALVQYKPYKENTLDKEAQANLKLIYAAERIYKFENDSNVYTDDLVSNSGINEALKLQLSTTTSPNWKYYIYKCTDASLNSRFWAKAERTADSITRNWCLQAPPPNGNDPEAYLNASCQCP